MEYPQSCCFFTSANTTFMKSLEASLASILLASCFFSFPASMTGRMTSSSSHSLAHLSLAAWTFMPFHLISSLLLFSRRSSLRSVFSNSTTLLRFCFANIDMMVFCLQPSCFLSSVTFLELSAFQPSGRVSTPSSVLLSGS